MNVLIMESKRHLAELWRRALERLGAMLISQVRKTKSPIWPRWKHTISLCWT